MQEKVNKFSFIKQRIMYFVESQSIKKVDFFNKIGVTSANFRGEAQKTPINSNAIENIITHYPEINLHWLITGNGEMLIKKNQLNVSLVNEPFPNYGNKEDSELIDILKETIADLKRDKEMLYGLLHSKQGKEKTG